MENEMSITYQTPEGQKMIASRKIKSAEEWLTAFPAKYQELPASIARSFAARDFGSVTIEDAT